MIDLNTQISATIANNNLEQILLNSGLDSLNENSIVLPLKLQNIKKSLQIMKDIDLTSLSISERFDDAHSMIDKADLSAKEIKETNFIIHEKNSLTGYNTYTTVLKNLIQKQKNKPIAIFGDGQFLKTTLFATYSLLPDLYTNNHKKKNLVKSLGLELYPIDSFVGKYPVIINTDENLKLPSKYLDAELFIDFLPLKKESPALKSFPKEKTLSANEIFIKQIVEKIFLLTNKYPSELYLKAKLNSLI